jgi:hypothetical protein
MSALLLQEAQGEAARVGGSRVPLPASRSSSPMPNEGAKITVEWGYELHSIRLTPHNWRLVKSGKPLNIRGKGYRYDGEFFWDYWRFSGGLDGALTVAYGDGGGVGFVGKLSGAKIEPPETSESQMTQSNEQYAPHITDPDPPRPHMTREEISEAVKALPQLTPDQVRKTRERLERQGQPRAQLQPQQDEELSEEEAWRKLQDRRKAEADRFWKSKQKRSE